MPSVAQKQQRISQRKEAVKENIILSQEKNIQKLNELVRSLQEQLLECRISNGNTSHALSSLAEKITELKRQHILED
ncbi:hypothetical protein Nepgr_014519 [Nepenthes gracilis]|uniref:Uncharacterized protein n=1 Tax=Nepenthes gracilis TaxID=150966 RepID=A0AAD3SJN7_NEPGR|nr:hypothetical protein Nepgr_014519 [Nepenthes gracilis]